MRRTLQQIQAIRFNSHDVQASFVVFLVALPLCLGIALASGAPASSGIIAGIVGGIIVGLLSPSEISVSGPAAGLTVLVVGALSETGSFEAVCVLTVIAGFIQIMLGIVRFGVVGSLIPTSVIQGMLAAIGLLIILKQLPHAVGFDADYFGDESFAQKDGDNTFTAITHSLSSLTYGAVVISCFSFFILIFWPMLQKKWKTLSSFPAPLVVVAMGLLANDYFLPLLDLQLSAEHLVTIPKDSFFSPLSFENFLSNLRAEYFLLALTLCLVGSLESILSIDASEKIDPLKRGVDVSRELYAQGIGNIVSGWLGGLPITAVVVRTTANVAAGASSRLSGILHSVWLLSLVLLAPGLLNKIPLSSLAVILIFVGFKLCSPTLFKKFIKLGPHQWIPFVATILAILFTDLLIGVLIGFVIGLFFVVKNNLHAAVVLVSEEDRYLLRFNKDTSFLNKPLVKKLFATIPGNCSLIIDGSRPVFIDRDIIEMVEDFVESAPKKNIQVRILKSGLALSPYFLEKN